MKDPKDVVIRLCRECGNPMKLESYEFDSDFRWYNFYCGLCEYSVSLSEAIDEDTRKWRSEEEGSNFLEPLTKEELEKQAFAKTPEGREQTKKMFEGIKDNIDAEYRRKKMREAHDLADKDKEDLI